MPEKKIIAVQQLSGLSEADVVQLQQQYGKNIFSGKRIPKLLLVFWDILKEPMFILLCVACAFYFFSNEINEGLLMLAAMLFVTAISVYQEMKSSKAIEALQQYTEPKIVVIRDGVEKEIASADLVPGDIMLLEEGNKIPADAVLLQQNDLTINESIITGESLPVEKSETGTNNILYQGTTINSGKCYARVTTIGNDTVMGKLGKSVNTATQQKTLLQKQVGKFARQLAIFGFAAFIIILALNYIRSKDVMNSFLFALTLAMAVIPEEIPVAFSSFMALGAFYMAKRGIITRQPQTIENLGAVSVICLDKTGTITQNKMQVKIAYDYRNNTTIHLDDSSDHIAANLLQYAMLASEKNPFDAMEQAIWEAYREHGIKNIYENASMIFEYPLEGKPPIMTHVYQGEHEKIIAAKGASERVVQVCGLSKEQAADVHEKVLALASKGYRVIAVASAIHYGEELPETQDNFSWQFEGLLALYDPVKENVKETIQQFYEAGIDVKLLTGDYPETAMNIASIVGIKNSDHYVSGTQVLAMNETELKAAVKNNSIFARMFPDAKYKVIEALKANNEIVAMLGDGVNDAPALKLANIGVAMGFKGTELAKQAADLILTDDDLAKLIEAIKQGRKIFSNLKKAIRYIVSIHIPIILTASLPVLLGWKYPNIFSPIHIIFFELIMGPTCSIFFEREPVEKNILKFPPRDRNKGIFDLNEMAISIIQGLVIAAGILSLYYYFMQHTSIEETRTIVFLTLMSSNVFLTFVNRSFFETIYKTIRYKNTLALPIVFISIVFLCITLYVPFVRNQFFLVTLSYTNIAICVAAAFAITMWFELYKLFLPARK